ncbi:MAG: adenylyltransferase/cytidyltransferase family protein [Candidatus Wildermuthbacteria bacterium]|nr:adenylyltransferase/cytidyltransferase family protein [Candidatus Wildermuthbacteria bacterium]
MKSQNNHIILDYQELKKVIDAHKTLGHKIVCTVGSWDMLHIGHLRYLMKAREHGDVLIVGVDSDRGIKLYKKNELRPVIPQAERMEMLKYQECVDYITLVDDIDDGGKWQYELIKTIRPNVFVATPEAYPDEQIKDIKLYSDDVLIFPRQAENTSTTEIIERMIKKHLEAMLSKIVKKG